MGEAGEAKTAIRTAAPEDDGCCVCGKSCAIINTILADVGCCFFIIYLKSWLYEILFSSIKMNAYYLNE